MNRVAKSGLSWHLVASCLLLVSTVYSPDKTEPPQNRQDNNAIARGSEVSTLLGSHLLFIGPRTPINPPNVGIHGQVMAAADPESQNNMIVCGYRANQVRGSSYEGYVYQSGDGGKTWREVLVDANNQWVSEESCAFGPGHQAYFAAGDSDTSRGVPDHGFGNLHLYRSSDGGRTWKTTMLNRFMDWTSMVVDTTQGPHRNTLYIFADSLTDGTGGWLYGDRLPVLAVHRELPELTFSVANGNFSSRKAGVKFWGRLPQGSAVLSDGTPITIVSGNREVSDGLSEKKTKLYSVEAVVSRDGGKSLEKTTIDERVVDLEPTGPAVNEVTDEIYVCWTHRYPGSVEGKLMLARSQDKGKTWNVTSVKSPEHRTLDVRGGSVSLAINKDGVLGFMWYGKNGDRVYFGASFDGGDSIAKVVQLTPDLPANMARNWQEADDRRLFVYPPAWNAPARSFKPLAILVFGPSRSGIPFGNALIADWSGAFHPIWSELDNGSAHLWTRAISLQAPLKDASVPDLDKLTDISDRIVSHVTNVRYDHLGNLITFDVTITNKSATTIAGPILVVVTTSPKQQLELSADNADNSKLGDGAFWELRIPSEGLGCQHSTEPRTLSFHMKWNDEDFTQYKPMDIPLRIYGNVR